VQYFQEELPQKQINNKSTNKPQEEEDIDHLRIQIIDTDSTNGLESTAQEELEAHEQIQRRPHSHVPQSEIIQSDNEFIRMCEENLSDITRRYLMKDPNPAPINYQQQAYRGALAADLKCSTILEDDNKPQASLRMSSSFQ